MSIVEYEVGDGVARITLNRPEKLNAIVSAMRIELARHLAAAIEDDNVRVIVVAGEGRAFCAGQDVLEIKDRSFGEDRRSEEYIRIFHSLRTSPKPTIARLHGHVAGAGMILALMFDLRIAGESLKMGMTEIGLGMPVRFYNDLIRKICGEAALRRIVLYSDFIGTDEALRFNAITELHPDHGLDARIDQLAGRLAGHLPSAVHHTKKDWADTSEGWFGEMIERVRKGGDRWEPAWKS